jgi:hypothetical protein
MKSGIKSMGLKAYATATKQTTFAQKGILGCFKANHNANTSNLSALAQEEIIWNNFISLCNGQGLKLLFKSFYIHPISFSINFWLRVFNSMSFKH